MAKSTKRQQSVAWTIRCHDHEEKKIVEAARAAGLGKGPYLIRCGLAMAPEVVKAGKKRQRDAKRAAASDPVAAVLGA